MNGSSDHDRWSDGMTTPAGPSLARALHERVEQALLDRVPSGGVLRVPLHPKHPPAFALDRLDETVG
jgi:hypothetical protein